MIENNNKTDGILAIEIIKKTTARYPRLHRILSMLLDHFLMCVLIIPIAIILSIIFESSGLSIDTAMGFFVFFLMIFVYLNKDFFKGKSPAKRIMGYQVIDRKTENAATELQCFVRNLTILVAWPLEAIIGFINPERRIGDFIANTKVVVSEKEKLISIWIDLKRTTLKLDYIGILIIGGIYCYVLSLLL